MYLSKKAQAIIIFIVFIFFTVSTTANVVYARSAEHTARDVKRDLRALKITTQSKCIVQMVLRYPPPVPPEQLPVILVEYDKCISEQVGSIQRNEQEREQD